MLPQDLVQFWQQTGGGGLFETAEILGPHGDAATADDLDAINSWHRGQGLPERYYVFATGTFFSAVRLPDSRYVVLAEDSYEEEAEYPTLAAWYNQTLRQEYAERYGLP
jgi:hypothetical protein